MRFVIFKSCPGRAMPRALAQLLRWWGGVGHDHPVARLVFLTVECLMLDDGSYHRDRKQNPIMDNPQVAAFRDAANAFSIRAHPPDEFLAIVHAGPLPARHDRRRQSPDRKTDDHPGE